MYQEYELLRLKLLRFSKYLQFDEEKEGISCPIAIQKLQKEKNKKGIETKYAIAFIVSGEKIVEVIKKPLKHFEIALFNQYLYAKQGVRIVVYLFDIRKDAREFDRFLTVLSQEHSWVNKAKRFFAAHPFNILGAVSVGTSAIITLFVYYALVGYGVVPQQFSGVSNVAFFLMLSFVLLSIAVFLFYLLLPLFLVVAIDIEFMKLFNMDIKTLNFLLVLIPIIVIIFFMLRYIKKRKPLWMYSLFENSGFIPFFASFIGVMMFGISILLILVPALSGIVTHDYTKHYWKSNYEMVMDIYQNTYSGYPKILTDKSTGKKYYVPFESGGRYYVYDINSTKEAYILKIKKDVKIKRLCVSKKEQVSFIKMYILDNPYIKPKYQSKSFKIDDQNITIEDFNFTEVLSYDDINRTLCDGRMK